MKFCNLGRLAVGLSFLLFSTCTFANPPAASYHLIKKIPLAAAPGGIEYFDYITVDSAARRVYVSHGTEVVVLNADDYTVVGTIGGLQRSHGVVVVKDLGKGYITDGDAQKVLIFDLKTLKVTGEVKTNQPDTDSIIYDPASKYIFTFNGNSHNSTVIDPVKEAVVKNIDLVGAVEFPAVDGKGMLYDNNEEKNDVVAIDTHSLEIKDTMARCARRAGGRNGDRRKEPAVVLLGPQPPILSHDGCGQWKSHPVVAHHSRGGR